MKIGPLSATDWQQWFVSKLNYLLKMNTDRNTQTNPNLSSDGFFSSSCHSRGKGTAVWQCCYEFVALCVQYFIGVYFILFLVMFTRNQLKLIVFCVYWLVFCVYIGSGFSRDLSIWHRHSSSFCFVFFDLKTKQKQTISQWKFCNWKLNHFSLVHCRTINKCQKLLIRWGHAQ